jgi:hypothetical protein
MNKILKDLAFLSFLLAVLVTGCQIAGTDNTEDVLISTAKYGLMQSSVIESEINEDLGLSKATIPDSASGSTIPGTFSKSDYPEKGQSTSFSVASTTTSNVYLVTATTTYSSSSIRDFTVESYYIYSANTTFDNTTTDYICDSSGTAAPKSRASFYTTIWYGKNRGNAETKSTRYETIAETSSVDGLSYAAFDIGGSLVYTDSPSIVTGTSTWSSKVTYTQLIPAKQMSLDSVLSTPSADTYTLVGTRYYTETDNGSGTTCSSLSYEKTTLGSTTVCESVVRTTYDIVGGVPGYKTVASRSVMYKSDGSTYTVNLDNELYSSL